jgi:hypothetical protein
MIKVRQQHKHSREQQRCCMQLQPWCPLTCCNGSLLALSTACCTICLVPNNSARQQSVVFFGVQTELVHWMSLHVLHCGALHVHRSLHLTHLLLTVPLLLRLLLLLLLCQVLDARTAELMDAIKHTTDALCRMEPAAGSKKAGPDEQVRSSSSSSSSTSRACSRSRLWWPDEHERAIRYKQAAATQSSSRQQARGPGRTSAQQPQQHQEQQQM